jgi:hypothetical protein
LGLRIKQPGADEYYYTDFFSLYDLNRREREEEAVPSEKDRRLSFLSIFQSHKIHCVTTIET